MASYQRLKDKPKRFLALTGYTPEEFSELFPCFSKCFLEFVHTHTLDGKQRKKRRYTPYRNSCFDTIEDMLLFTLIYLRKAMTQDVLGELFDMSQPLTNRGVHLLLPILNQALAELGELPSRETEPTTFDVASDTATSRLDGHAPISVMGEHGHKAGEMILAYRFMAMDMRGLQSGKDVQVAFMIDSVIL